MNLTTLLNYMVVVHVFFLPLSRAGVSFFTVFLLLLWVIEGDFKNKASLLIKNKVVIAIVLFLAMNIVSLLWTNDVSSSLDYIRRYWYLLPIVVLYTSIKKEFIPIILSAFIMGMFISEVISYGVYFDLWEFKHATKNNISPFMHHIEYSSFLAFTALILLSRIFSIEDIKLKILYSFFFITMSGNLFLTAGRTGQIALILGLYVLALISFKNKFKAVFISTVLTVLLVTAAYNYSTTFHDRVYDAINSTVNVIQSNDYCSSWGSRVGAYITAQDIILEHPILGAGISDNMDSFRNIVDMKYPYMKCIKSLQHMHNQYLQVVTQLGFVGLFFFLFIFYNLGSMKLVSKEFSNMKYLYLTVLTIAFIAEVLFHRAFSLALFSFVVGLLLAQNRVENEV